MARVELADITPGSLRADARRPASAGRRAAACEGLADITLGSLWADTRRPAAAEGLAAAR